jgi:flagellar hook protein FlgE
MALTFFRIKKDRFHSLYIRTRTKKFAKEKDTYISKKKSILILGLHSSGKTKQLNKIIEQKELIYKKKKFIILRATDSISEMIDKNITEEEKEKFQEDTGIDKKMINKQYIKIQILLNKAKESVLMVDDIDKFTGKKLEILKDLIREVKQYIVTAKDDKSIDKTLLRDLEKKDFEKMVLSTKMSYDATNILFVIFLLIVFGTGNVELAGLLMIGRYLTKDVSLNK